MIISAPILPTEILKVVPEKPLLEIPNVKKMLVLVYQRPNLRKEDFSAYRGKNYLEDLFNPEIPNINKEVKELYFHYPERWLNIVEQRSLLTRIGKYMPNVEELVIVTHSVYIIQCVKSDYIRIMTPLGFDGILPNEEESGKLYI